MDLDGAIAFILELDRTKHIVRQCRVADGSRLETDAEHMWHLAVAAMVLTPPHLDRDRVVAMALIHDVVEIDAGDVPIWEDDPDRVAREGRAAERLFSIHESGDEFRELWGEFESETSEEARFCRALDRFLPGLPHYASGGIHWREHGISAADARELSLDLASRAPQLFEFATRMIDDAERRNMFSR